MRASPNPERARERDSRKAVATTLNPQQADTSDEPAASSCNSKRYRESDGGPESRVFDDHLNPEQASSGQVARAGDCKPDPKCVPAVVIAVHRFI